MSKIPDQFNDNNLDRKHKVIQFKVDFGNFRQLHFLQFWK